MGARPSDSAARADAAAIPTPGNFSTGSDCCAAARTTRRLLPAAAGRAHTRLTLLLHVAACRGTDRAVQGLDYALDWQSIVSRLLHRLDGVWRGCSQSYRSSDQPSVCGPQPGSIALHCSQCAQNILARDFRTLPRTCIFAAHSILTICCCCVARNGCADRACRCCRYNVVNNK